MGCPIAARLQRQVVTLGRFAEAHKKVSDLPDMKKMERWWNRKNFQPWAEEEETELKNQVCVTKCYAIASISRRRACIQRC